MKLLQILTEIEDFKHHSQTSKPQYDHDDIVLKGFKRGPDILDPVSGKITNAVLNGTDFNRAISDLYKVFKEIKKYRTVSYPKISLLAKTIMKDITQTIADVKSMQDYCEIIKQGLK